MTEVIPESSFDQDHSYIFQSYWEIFWGHDGIPPSRSPHTAPLLTHFSHYVSPLLEAPDAAVEWDYIR